MPDTKVHEGLRLKARMLIEGGELPPDNDVRLWGGMGTGGTCALCGRAIESGQVQYEVEHQDDSGKRGYRLHMVCHAAWQLECRRK